MRVTQIRDEDFTNYKKASMFIGACFCDWKCCNEQGLNPSICQNHSLHDLKNINMFDEEIYDRYINNPITSSIVIGGLEPMLQIDEIIDLIKVFRERHCDDDFVIYTGYYENEIASNLERLQTYSNIIIKFGRFIPDQKSHYDEILGINLASDNQYGKKIS